MLTNLNKFYIGYIKASIMFLPVILYPPIIFATMVPPQIRIGGYLLLNLYIFFYQKRYFKYDIYIFCMLLFLSIIMASRNIFGTGGLLTAGNYLLTLFFGWGLCRYLSTSKYRTELFIGLYIKFFILISTFSVLSVLFMVTFGELNLFGLNYDLNHYDYKVTPFGLLLVKTIGTFKVYRSFFYFIEPLYVSIFYVANIFFIVPYMKNNSRLFFIANLIGGMLTYSYAFYMLLIAAFITNKLKSQFSITFLLLLLFIFV